MSVSSTSRLFFPVLRSTVVSVGLTLGFAAFGQDDLLNMMGSATPAREPVKASFKTTRIVSGHSIEQTAKRHLDFRISHRFGQFDSGFDDLYGLDAARIRLGLEYGLTQNIMVGIGRSNFGWKSWDYFGKFRVLRQTTDNAVPVSVSLFGSLAVDIIKNPLNNELPDRMTTTIQALIARKFSESFSLQLTPTWIHRNKVAAGLDADVFALGAGGRIKLTRRLSFNAEYFYLLNPEKVQLRKPVNNLSIGLDIETGGHVFQLHFTNSRALIEKDFITTNTLKWDKGEMCFGFNISRTFSFKGKPAKE